MVSVLGELVGDTGSETAGESITVESPSAGAVEPSPAGMLWMSSVAAFDANRLRRRRAELLGEGIRRLQSLEPLAVVA